MDTSRDAALATEIRAEAGRQRITKRAHALAAGVAHSTANRKLNGEVAIDLDDLEAFARVLRIEPGELVARAYSAALAAATGTDDSVSLTRR